MSDRSQRTEQPTQRRLQKARKQGQFPVSKDFVGAFQFAIFVGLLTATSSTIIASLVVVFRELLTAAFTRDLTVGGLMAILRISIVQRALHLFAGAGLLLLATVALHLFTTRFGFATSKLAPDLNRLNPLNRIRQLPSQNSATVVQTLVLLPVFSYAVYAVIAPELNNLIRLPLAPLRSGVETIGSAARNLLWKGTGIFVLLGCIDFYRQRRRFQSEMRMTKQEVREEHKESEGNPQMKQRIRRLQRDAARRNMMKNLPTATAVIVNPTHFAVALRYEIGSMSAPAVVAKGKNYLALRIRAKAESLKIPIVENPPLAQTLYKSVEVGQEIPSHLYQAVAEILAYIYRLTHGPKAGAK